jgi:tetratricopeptide (TPR) repeat protein
MGFAARTKPDDAPSLPPGVTPIDRYSLSRRADRTLSKAVSLHLEGKLEGAAGILSRAIESGVRDPALYSALGHIHYEMRDYESAAAIYEQLAALEPLHRVAHFNLGVCRGNLKRWQTAVESFRRAAEADATRADAWLGLGLSLIHSGRPAEAMKPLDWYLNLFCNDEQALFAKGVALQQTGQLAEAAEHYRRVLARNPRCEEALANLVSVFLEKKDHQAVRRYAEMLAELRPESPVALEALAALAFEDGDYAAAVRYSHSLSQLVPECFENWFNLGMAHHMTGDYEKAAHAYTEAIALKPDSVEAHLNLGAVRQELNDLARARACYEKALEIDPGQPGVLWNLALVLEQQGELDQAEELYAALPEDAPEWCDGCFRLGYLRLLRGDFAASAEAFEACLEKRPDWPEAHLNAGIAYARSGNAGAARRCFEEALVLRPDSLDALRGLAALALDCQDYSKAYDLHRRLIHLGEHGPELCYNAGLLCQKLGRTDEAAKFYRQALSEDPQRLEALLNLGHVLMASGKPEEARSCWRRAISEKPELAEAYFEP